MMQSHSLTLKVSPAGRAFMRFLAAFNTGDAEKIADFVHTHYNKTTLMQTPPEQIVNFFLDLHAQTNGLHIYKVYSSERFHVMVIVRAMNDRDTMFLDKLKVDDLPPHGVVEYLHEKLPENMG